MIAARTTQCGSSLIEVLVTIVILMFGLLGMAGLQAKALSAQMESYQRSQALALLKDMVERINANRANAAAYVTTVTGARGTGYESSSILDCAGLTGATLDLCEWHNALLGSAEKQGSNNVGAMIGARGCITRIGTTNQYVIAVAWQGLSATATPANTCGQNQYGSDAYRRVVATPITIATLL